jgi:hypothetical protein
MEVVLGVGVLDVAQQFGLMMHEVMMHEVHPAAQRVTS